MFGFIIFAYPLSLFVGIVLGAVMKRCLAALGWSATAGAAMATFLSLEFFSMVSFSQLLLEMILPAAAICAFLGVAGAGFSLSVSSLARKLRSGA